MEENKRIKKTQHNIHSQTKKIYHRPELKAFGEIRELTKNVVFTSGEGQSGMGMP